MNDMIQGKQSAEKDIAALRDFLIKYNDYVKKCDVTPEKPKAYDDIANALEAVKKLDPGTKLDSQNPEITTLLDCCRAFTLIPTFPSLPLVRTDPARDIIENTQLDDLPLPQVESVKKPKLTMLLDALGDYKNGYFVSKDPPVTREQIQDKLSEAKAEAKEYPGKFEAIFKERAAVFKKRGERIVAAITTAISQRQALVDQQVKNIADLEKQSQRTNVTSLIEQLPYLVGILCVLFIAIILLIKFYPADLQTEWVASGQVIQLLTVVTLLLIILCLAVTQIIKENTIGTLLGGIGGYVLSQGIGRAAAREASRTK